MARTKKVTAQELDAQIGYGKEIDVKAVVSKMKKDIKTVRNEVAKTSPSKKGIVATETARELAQTNKEVIKKRATKIAEQVKIEEPKKTVTKVHIAPSKDNTCLEVWVAYKQEGYVRTIWKSYPSASIKEALKLAERYLSQIELSKVEAIA